MVIDDPSIKLWLNHPAISENAAIEPQHLSGASSRRHAANGQGKSRLEIQHLKDLAVHSVDRRRALRVFAANQGYLHFRQLRQTMASIQ